MKCKYLLIVCIWSFLLFGNKIINAQTMVQWYTSLGNFNAQLREDLVPVTAQNFIDLANSHFYDGLIFHRVISGFMIQDGCPLGNGTGNPGYVFDDEFHQDLRHNEAGILSMANEGPNTNGSQYFITVDPATWLNDKYSVFGKIIDGLDVVINISEVDTDANDKPIVDVVIDSVRVITPGTKDISITLPAAESIYLVNKEQPITWQSQFIADVNIYASYDNGSTWYLIADSISCNAKMFEWHTPDTMAQNCRIKITDATDTSVYAISSKFSFGNLNLLSPNSGYYHGNKLLSISWEADSVKSIGLAYQDEINGAWHIIADSILDTCSSYDWQVPQITTNTAKIKVFATQSPFASDMSFSYVRFCLLDLLSPQVGDSLFSGSTEQIVWSNSNNVYKVALDFSSDNGATWQTINTNIIAGNYSYNWLVPNIISDSCFIKLYFNGTPELYSQNSEPFSIVAGNSVENKTVNDVSITITPNPVSSILKTTCIFDEPNKEISYSIYNVLGKQVFAEFNKKIISDKYTFYIDVSHYNNGVYFMNITIDGDMKTTLFIKQ